MINKKNTLIILDWDDTLFPTTWIVKNNINIENDIEKYKKEFIKLDKLLYKTFKKLLNYGQVAIITNAMLKWVLMSLKVLPITSKLINNKIQIISARDECENSDIELKYWKTVIFNDYVTLNFKNQKSVQNILSIGDAEYEINALINLNDKKYKKRLLKAVKFIPMPKYEVLLEQIEILNESIENICNQTSHMDLKIIPIEEQNETEKKTKI